MIMKLPVIYFLFMAFIAAEVNAQAPNAPSGRTGAIRAAIDRITAGHAKQVVIEWIPSAGGKDVFELQSSGGRLFLRGSSSSAIGYGFHWYLTYYCHAQVSRAGTQLQLPDPLPQVPRLIRVISPYRFRYFLNYCTFNYSMAFWDWARWEKELDWMALNGINMSLSVIGMEAVWQNTLRKFSFSDNEIKAFIPGPAYTAWWLMGNLEGWGGPVSQAWIDGRVKLEQKILRRMRELGIHPVMQGFYGIVPDTLREKFPGSKTYYGGIWAGDHGFRRPAFLDPQDSLFAAMAKVFYSEEHKLYGDVDFYGGDPFHEGGNSQGIDIGKSAALIHKAMLKAHPAATWVLQGWSGNPTDKLLQGAGKSHVMILDLFAEGEPQWEKRRGYDGRPWAWCTLLNFGSKVGLYGKLDTCASAPFRALASSYGRSLCGIGTMSEGIETNPVNYECIYEMAWRSRPPDLKDWMKDFAFARYGRKLPAAEQAWAILHETAYNCPTNQYGCSESIFCARPCMDVKAAWKWGTIAIYYDTARLRQALHLLLSCAGELARVDTYQYDLVDLSRQVIADYGQRVYRQLIDAFNQRDSAGLDNGSRLFILLIQKQDSLLATRKEFLLGNWIHAAKAIAASPGDTAMMEWNARTLISVWGNMGVAEDLHEYSNREWNGMLGGLYLQRWMIFLKALKGFREGSAIVPIDFYPLEKAWTYERTSFPALPTGDPAAVAASIISELGL